MQFLFLLVGLIVGDMGQITSMLFFCLKEFCWPLAFCVPRVPLCRPRNLHDFFAYTGDRLDHLYLADSYDSLVFVFLLLVFWMDSFSWFCFVQFFFPDGLDSHVYRVDALFILIALPLSCFFFPMFLFSSVFGK